MRRYFGPPPAVLPVLGLLCLGSAAAAQAPAASNDVAAQGPFCASGRWQLDGAAAVSDTSTDAALPAAWSPLLDEIAGCVAQRGAERACLYVEGRHDEQRFPAAVVKAFGGEEAAQAARARGRASLVLRELGNRGVAAERLHEAPPPATPSWRGVEIRLESACLPAPQGLSAEDRRLLEEARLVIERDRERQDAPPPAPPPAVPQAPTLVPFAELSLHGSLGVSDPATVASPGLRLAAGARAGWLGARIGVGAAAAAREEQRNALEAFAAAEVHLLPWLAVGPVAGLRFGAPDTDAPWLERSFFAGLEASERLLTFGGNNHLILQQAILPFASQERRGEIGAGRLERIPSTSESLVRYELGFSLRHDL
ncbi:hypothetical protein [Vulgatibacter sp.]|uniref:hypothetical protein n=1 Tax=Vulgatibacter sp. TaxID=1971226 RepID=UPI0035699AF6